MVKHSYLPTSKSRNERKKDSKRTNECIQISPCNIMSIQGRLTWLLLMDPNPNEGKVGNLCEELITVKGEPKMLVGLKPTQLYTSFKDN